MVSIYRFEFLPPCVTFDCISNLALHMHKTFVLKVVILYCVVFNFYLQYSNQKTIMTSAVKQQLAALANVGGTPKDQADR